MKILLKRLFIFYCFSSLAFAQSPLQLKIEELVDPRPLDLAVEVPWSMGVKSTTPLAAGELLLQPCPTLFQDRPGDPGAGACVWLPSSWSQGTTELVPTSLGTPFQFRQDSGRLYLDESGQPVLAFVFEPQLAEGVPEDRRRAVYIHPLYDPLGQIITDDFPKDHYHHRGLSWMWQRVTIAEKEYDLWHLVGIHQQFEKWLCQESGPIAAVLAMQNSWQVEGRRVLEERVWLRVFRASGQGRLIDMRLSLRPLEPISLLGAENKGYSGLSFRFAPRDCTVITSPLGRVQEDSNDQLFIWTDLSARFRGAGQFSGAAILQHPGNPGAPAEWCIRYYGFLGVSWPGLHRITLEADKVVTFRFRLWLHRGSAGEAFLPSQYENFIHPPQIRLMTD